MKFVAASIFSLSLISLTTIANAALIVTPTNDANVLALTIAGPGITITGPVLLTNTTLGSGTFTGGTSAGIGIDEGIVLTTGTATGAQGPNTIPNFTGPGNFTTLQFNFESATGQVFFNYVFASEEYNGFVGSNFNDTFKLFVDGVNIALVPNSATPVEINTVNLGLNSLYYVNNSTPNPPNPLYNIQYDGFTTVLTASTAVADGVHVMQFSVADVGDSSFDSAVFVQKGSFSGTDPDPVPEPATLAMLGVGLLGLGFAARRKRT